MNLEFMTNSETANIKADLTARRGTKGVNIMASKLDYEILNNGEVISEERYNDGKKEVVFRYVKYENCYFYITTWDGEIVFLQFDKKG